MTLNERATRKQLIDHALSCAGWLPTQTCEKRVRYERGEVEEYPTSKGPADYALFSERRQIVIVEAKKLAVDPKNVLQQAQRYAPGLDHSPFEFNGYHVPFIYATNGEAIWFHSLRQSNSRSRRLAAFHTPAALEEMLSRDTAGCGEWLRMHPVDHPRLRPYQIETIQRTESSLYDGKRSMLVAMATDPGKTLLAIYLIYRLMKLDMSGGSCKWAKPFNSFRMSSRSRHKLKKYYHVYSPKS